MADVLETLPGAKATEEGQDVNQNKDTKLPASIEELNALIQRESDRRVSEANKKFEATYKNKLETEKAEAARLAKLTADQREKELFEKDKAELLKQKEELSKAQLHIQTIKELTNASLPVAFADMIMGADADTTLKNINSFKTSWQTELQKAVDEKLKGSTPRKGDVAGDSSINDFMETIKKNRSRR